MLKYTLISAFNSKHERIEGAWIFHHNLGKLKFFTSVFQCGIAHKVFCLRSFLLSSTNRKCGKHNLSTIQGEDLKVSLKKYCLWNRNVDTKDTHLVKIVFWLDSFFVFCVWNVS